jgi:hypothetical protein
MPPPPLAELRRREAGAGVAGAAECIERDNVVVGFCWLHGFLTRFRAVRGALHRSLALHRNLFSPKMLRSAAEALGLLLVAEGHRVGYSLTMAATTALKSASLRRWSSGRSSYGTKQGCSFVTAFFFSPYFQPVARFSATQESCDALAGASG